MSILNTFANAYGIDAAPYVDMDSRSRIVRELLAPKRALIVLDNVESSSQAKPLLPPTTRCAVLITTRRRNLSAARGGWQFAVGPFNAAGQESLLLFRKVLGEEKSERERQTRQAIAAVLGHLPLAVDIAASRLAYEPGWSEEAFLQRLQRGQRRLQELSFEDQSVRLSLEASYSALPEAGQQFFAGLGVITGEDFTPAAAATILDISLEEAEDGLRQLFSLSLAQRGRPGRYQLHPLVRAFARERLSPEVLGQVERRLVYYYVTFAATHERDMQALALEQDHILEALQIAQEQATAPDMTAYLVSGVIAAYYFWETQGYYDLAENQLRQAETALRLQPDSERLSAILHSLGRVVQRRGQFDRAEAYYEEGLEQARLGADTALTSDLLRSLGVLAARRGDYALAEAYYQEGLTLARSVGQSTIASNLLRGLGVQAFMRGDYTRAETFYEEGLALARTAGELDQRSGLFWALGMLAEDQGDLEEAVHYLQESLNLVRQLGHRERVTAILRDLGLIALEQGKTEAAAGFLQEAVTLARTLGHFSRLNGILLAWGEMQLLQEAWGEAEGAFGEVLMAAGDAGNQVMMAEALFGLARAAAACGDWAQGQAQADASARLFKTMGHSKAGEVMTWQQVHALSANQS